jgi:hypothetical protein
MEPGSSVFHVAVDFEGREKGIVFAALTNGVPEIGAQWSTWDDTLIKTSFLVCDGKLGVKFALTGMDMSEKK